MRIRYYAYDATPIDALQAVHGVQWWLRPVRWLLAKLGYEIGRWGTSITYETITYKPQDIVGLIKQQVMDIHRHTGKRPETVILGREQQWELMDKICEYPMAFSPGGQYPDRVFGLTMILHPLIDGVIVVPQT